MSRELAKYSDNELAELLTGDKTEAEAAFTEFYNRYAQAVHIFCKYMVNDTQQAEDIFQETFIRFYKNISPGAKHTNVKSFLMTIARNLSINYQKAHKHKMEIEDFEHVRAERIDYEKKELFDLVVQSLELLDDIYRESFILREFDELPYKQIAQITDTTVSNAKSRVQRARKKIADILQPYMKDIAD